MHAYLCMKFCSSLLPIVNKKFLSVQTFLLHALYYCTHAIRRLSFVVQNDHEISLDFSFYFLFCSRRYCWFVANCKVRIVFSYDRQYVRRSLVFCILIIFKYNPFTGIAHVLLLSCMKNAHEIYNTDSECPLPPFLLAMNLVLLRISVPLLRLVQPQSKLTTITS